MTGPRLRLAAVVVSALCFWGCGDDDEAGPTAPEPQLTRVYVSNYSPDSITAVYVRLVGQGDWGPNRITGTISGGDTLTLVGEFPEGRYDLRLVGNLQTVEYLDQLIEGDYIAYGYGLTPRAADRPARSRRSAGR